MIQNEKSASQFKVNKEHITIMMCTNASDSHRLKFTIIGKSKKPRCFKDVKMNNFPINYLQKNAWKFYWLV